MFEEFQHDFPRDLDEAVTAASTATIPPLLGLPELLCSLGGSSFGGGVYRILSSKDLEVWGQRVAFAFPHFEDRIVCFGYDWLGTVFALHLDRSEGGQPGVVMFEPGTGEALKVPSNVLSFHNTGLKQFGDAALANSFYQEWLSNGGQRPSITQCVGYKRPLFLGGKDTIDNLELSDIDVYWQIFGQLIREARRVSKGTPVHIHKG